MNNSHPPTNSDPTFSTKRTINNPNDANELDYYLNYALQKFAEKKLPEMIGKGMFSLRIDKNIVDGDGYGSFEKIGDNLFGHSIQRNKEFEVRIWMNEITFQEEPTISPFELVKTEKAKPWDKLCLELNLLQRVVLWITEKLYNWSEEIVKDKGVELK